MSDTIDYRRSLPVGSIGPRASGWWGAVFLLLSETSIFAYLFFSYFYFSVQPHPGGWVPPGQPDLSWPGAQLGVMFLATIVAVLLGRAARAGGRLLVLIGLAVEVVLGAAYIALQFADWYDKPFSLSSTAYSSLYFMITGVHLAHVVFGWIATLFLLVWVVLGYFNRVRHLPITIGVLYWYFLGATYLGVFLVLDVTPFLA